MEKWEELENLVGKNKGGIGSEIKGEIKGESKSKNQGVNPPAEGLGIRDFSWSFSGRPPDENQGEIYSENSGENQDEIHPENEVKNISKFPILKTHKMTCKSYRDLPPHPVHPAVCDWHFQEADPICRLKRCVNFRAMEMVK